MIKHPHHREQQYIANFEFFGDPSLHQLAFAQNTVIHVSSGQHPKNGWLWGVSHNGSRGWFPVWAVDYKEDHEEDCHTRNVREETTPTRLTLECNPDDTSGHQQHQQATTNSVESGFFDVTLNGIMGGKSPKQDGSTGGKEGNYFSKSSSSNNDSQEEHQRQDSTNLGLLGRFRKPKVIPLLFQQQDKAKTPDWTPVPQIIYDGRVIHDFSQSKKKRFFSFST